MKIRFLCLSCVENFVRNHIIIDPDFTRKPGPDVKFILVSRVRMDDIGRVSEVP